MLGYNPTKMQFYSPDGVGGGDADYSLSTEIQMLFKTETIDDFTSKIAKLNDAFAQIRKDATAVNTDIASRLQDELKKITQNSADNDILVNVGDKLYKKLENQFAKALSRMQPTITGMEGEGISVEIKGKALTELKRNISNEIANKVKIGDQFLGNTSFKFTKSQQDLVRAQFDKFLDNTLKGSMKFDWEGLKKGDKFLSITEKHAQTFLDTVSNKFMELLSTDSMLQIGDNIKPVKVDSEQINKALANVGKALEGLDEQLNINFKDLEKLPTVDASLSNFRTNLRKLYEEVNLVNKTLDGADLKAGQKQLEEIRQELGYMRSTIANKIGQFLTEIDAQISNIPMGSLDYAKHKVAIESIGNYVDSFVMGSLEGVQRALLQAMGVSRVKSGDKDVIVPTIDKLRKLMIKAATEAVENVSEGNLTIDVAPINTAFKTWAAEMSSLMENNSSVAMLQLSKGLLDGHEAVTNAFIDSLMTLSSSKLILETKANEGLKIVLPTSRIEKEVLPKLQDALMDILLKATPVFTEGGVDKVNIPAESMDSAKAKVENALRTEIKRFMDNTSGLEDTGLSAKQTNSINKMLGTEASKVLDVLVTRARVLVETFSTGVGSEGFNQLTQTEQNKINKMLSRAMSDMLNNFTSSMQSALATIMASNEIGNTLKAELEGELKNIITASKISSDSNVDMDSIYNRAVEKLEAALNVSISKWTPAERVAESTAQAMTTQEQVAVTATDVAQVKESINSVFNSLSMNLVRELQTMVSAAKPTGEAQASMKLIGDLTNQFFNQYIERVASSMFGTNMNTRDFSVSYASLHPDVRKRLASEAGSTVREYGKDNKTISGEQALEQNMNVIFDKFHASTAQNTKAVIDEYQKAIKAVEVKPDISAVNYLGTKMTSLNQDIVRKVKKILDEQFNSMSAELKGLKLAPQTVGFSVPVRTAKTVESAVKSTAPTTIGSTGNMLASATEGAYARPVYRAVGGASKVVSPGGDTHTFAGSVVNTMRYISANWLMMYPMMALSSAMESAKEFDYQLEKSKQNLLAKYPVGKEFRDLAERQVKARYENASQLKAQGNGDYAISEADYNDTAKREQLIRAQQSSLTNMSREGAIRPLQNMAVNYGINQQDTGTIFQIATRRLDNPYEAMKLAGSAAKIYATESDEITPEEAAKGMESIASQWGLKGNDYNNYSNMVIGAALQSQASSKDILDAQERSGAIFKQFLPKDMPKEIAFATSTALQSMFVQSTARSGNEAGTFWRTVFEAPFTKDIAKQLSAKSQGMTSNGKSLDYLNPYTNVYDSNTKLVSSTQKSGYEEFKNIMQAYMDYRSAGQDQQANDLISMVYKNRNMGSQQAIQALVEDMNKAYDTTKSGNFASVDDLIGNVMGVENFSAVTQKVSEITKQEEEMVKKQGENVKKTQEYTDLEKQKSDIYSTAIQQGQENLQKQVDRYIGGMLNTFEGKQKIVTASWQATSYSVFEEMKPEFASFMDSMTAIMRGIRNNATSFANSLELIAKVAVGIGAQQLSKKLLGKVNNAALGFEYAGNIQPMLQERARLNKRGLEIDDLVGAEHSKYSSIDEERANALKAKGLSDEKYARDKETYGAVTDKLVAARNELALIDSGDTETIARKKKHIANLSRAQNTVGASIKDYENTVTPFDTQKATVTSNIDKLDKELSDIQVSHSKNDARMNTVSKAFRDMGLSATTADAKVAMLSKEIEKSSMSAMGYSSTISRAGTTTANAGSSTTRLAEQMAVLDTRFQEGKISAHQYLTELNKLQNLETFGAAGTQQASILGMGGISTIFSKKGLSQIGGAVGNVAKSAAQIGAFTIITNALGSFLTDLPKSQSERASSDVESQKKAANLASNYGKGIRSGNPLEIGMSLIGTTLNGALDLSSMLLKGNTSGMKDWFSSLVMGIQGKSSTEIQESLGVPEKQVQAEEQLAKEKRDEDAKIEKAKRDAGWVDIDGDGKADKSSWRDVSSVEDAQTMMSRINDNMSQEMATASAYYATDKANARIAGFRENSDKIRELTAQYIQANLKSLENAKNEIQDRLNQMKSAGGSEALSSPAAKELQKNLDDISKQIAEAQLSAYENAVTVFQRIQDDLQLAQSNIDSSSNIKRASLMMGGAREDSPTVTTNTMWNMAQKMAAQKKAIAEMQSNLSTVSGQEKETKKGEILKAQSDLATMEEQYKNLAMQDVNYVVNQASRDKQSANADYNTTRAKLEAKGYSDDSVAVRMNSVKQLQNENAITQKTIDTLQQIVANNGWTEDSAQYQDTWLKIKDYQQNMAENIAKIYQLQNKQASWGLPSGIKPMTNYEYYAKQSSEKAVATTVGNTTISVKFDNVYASSKEEIEKNIVKPIVDTVKSVTDRKQSAAYLNSQVSRYVSNYRRGY